MMNVIFYNPTTQYENTGDLLINKSLVNLLRRHGQLIVNDNNKPAWFLQQLLNESDAKFSEKSKGDGLNFLAKVLLKNVFRTSKEKRKYYVVFVPGHFARKGIRNAAGPVKMLLKMILLRSLGCKFIRVGFSIGDYDIPNAFVESLITRCYTTYAVRDQQSILKAKSYFFKTPEYFPDLAWAYDHSSIGTTIETKNQNQLKYAIFSFRANGIGLNFETEFYSELISHLSSLLKHQLFRNYRIIFAYQVDADRIANRKLADELSNMYSNVEFHNEKLGLDTAYDLYGNADFVITNRLHVLLLAMKANTLSFALINEHINAKIFNILKDNNLVKMVLNIKGITSENHDNIQSCLLKTDEILEEIQISMDRNKEEIERKINMIFE
ncbi:polysaccharide pyruvyl transferase family protein [Pedobacter sp. MC2016-05]|uniref:polysaccharide pyruvyl transferase family protein n=1 Tax=Pedobacter sp. MC2016-05 TaxID=2994474 RepID=UPI00224599D7|nr:polysaccharide pyruvyl transferase family protein [Pedobacter sp. MC2016-05]MCX2473227.1 polysaccharide pyruvyl transferase family protein [Pedobacter sp. MC2016-05]